MTIKRQLSGIRPASTPPTRRVHTVALWRIWTALLTVITFAVLVSTAAMHHHATALEDQDCSVCSVVTHKVTNLPLVVLPKLVVVFLSYSPFLLPQPIITLASPVLLPPSCGPPAAPSTIC